MSNQQGGDNQNQGPRLSLKAIAEEALQRSREAQRSQQPQAHEHPAQEQTSDVRPAPNAVIAAATIAAPTQEAPVYKPTGSPPGTRRILVAGVAIVLASAALSAFVAWWVIQNNTRAPETISASMPTAQAVHPTPALPAPPTPASAADVLPITPTQELVPAPTASAASTTNEEHAPSALSPSRGIKPSSSPNSATPSSAASPAPAAQAPAPQAPALQARDRSDTAANTAAPLTPSVGAVQAAVGSVLSYARACIAGESQSSHARLTFASSGTVSSVSLSGPAAGTPAEPCIKAALSKARVAPFQKESYSVDTAIRP